MVSVNEALRDLAAAFPRQTLAARTLNVYLADLQDLPPDALAAAVVDLRRTNDYFPTIKEIRQAVAERVLNLPTEALALAQVEQRMSWRHDHPEDVAAPPLHPLVKEALNLVGGVYAFRNTDEPSVLRGQFGRLYRDLRAGAVRRVQVDGNLLKSADGPLMLPVSC